jgi:CBS domain containing-hemolysin-like protein
MIQFIVALVFLLIALGAITLLKTYYYLPRRELQRQARAHHPLAVVLWRAVAFGSSLQLLLWTVIGVSAGVGLVLLTRVAPPVLGIVVVALTVWLGFVWIPRTRLTSFGGRLAGLATPTVVWLLSVMQPVWSWTTQQLGRFSLGAHTGLYEREDLEDIIERQAAQPDNRISNDVLDLARRALKFDDYRVADVVVSRVGVKSLSADEAIGPVLMDELHAAGHSRFPVYQGDKNNIVGTLYLRDIVDGKRSGTVATYADRHVFYVHENDRLSEALRAFRQAKQQLLVVVNSFEEYVGIITVTDVLQKLLTMDNQAFSGHDDKAAVAHKHDAPTVPEPESTPEVAETVPEVVE